MSPLIQIGRRAINPGLITHLDDDGEAVSVRMYGEPDRFLFTKENRAKLLDELRLEDVHKPAAEIETEPVTKSESLTPPAPQPSPTPEPTAEVPTAEVKPEPIAEAAPAAEATPAPAPKPSPLSKLKR